MNEQFYIDKKRVLTSDQDYAFLRAEGLKYIEELASALWTDYNTHDPGVTILEALCYAITELGYRTSFDVKTLVSDVNGNIDTDQAFFSAKQILSSETLTIEDYRKLLVDIVGVKNAWLYPYRDEDLNLIGEPDQEVPLYAHCKKDMLVYEETEHRVHLHGLYRVVLDLEETDEYGDLNTGAFTYQFATAELLNIRVQILMPSWFETDKVDYEFISGATNATITILSVTLDANRWKVNIRLDVGGDIRELEFEAYVLLKKDISAIAAQVTAQFNDLNQLKEIFKLYQKKTAYIVSIITNAKSALHAHRNLCEDFIKIETICTQEVAFCADIEVTPETDIEEVYASVLFQLENYLNPEVKFYSLNELIKSGVPTDEIFEGPILTHGFIKTDELKATRIRSRIHVSDIINFIMDIEGVLAVKNVLFTKYDHNGKPTLPSERWCLEIENGCKPVLNIFKSKVLFFKGKLPFRPKLDETLDTLKYLHGLEQRNKLKGTADDLEMPLGKYQDIGDYLTVQYEFPQTYGIGPAGLGNTVPPLRKAQAKQLKAYLMFADQLIANFFSQLAHAKDLFSIKEDVHQTYFAQFLSDIDGMDQIYANATDLEAILSAPSPGDSPVVKKTRSLLIENENTFHDRRNRFVDHLIARFAESFSEYVLMLYSYKNANDYADIEADELIKDKLNFLKDYPVISSERGTAYDLLQPAWDTSNVSGYEKRMARLSGIDDFTRRFLFCLRQIEIQKTETDPAQYFYRVFDEQGNALIQALKMYDTYAEVEVVISALLKVVDNPMNYQNVDISSSEFAFEIWDDANVPLAQSGLMYPDSASRDAAILSISELMGKDCPGEGMHLVEHILLRPRFTPPVITGSEPEDVYKVFHVCLGENCDFCGEEDPYSFRMSLVLPYWHERFKAPEFRRYFEDMARTEAPAHCMIKVCWVNNTLMNLFERAYKEWMEAQADYCTDLIPKESKQDRLRLANNAMIDIMKELHSEYPEARLHDCDTGVTNPVLLNNTTLGTYKL